jgi:hypothetical protein
MKRLIATLLLTLPGLAAASQGQGKIASIWTAPDSPYVMFSLASPIEDLHRCNSSERFSVNLKSIGGRAVHETLLMARANGLAVRVVGLNTCNPYAAENIKNLVVY